MLLPRLAIASCLIAFVAGCGTVRGDPPVDDAARRWQRLATEDIGAVHEALAAAHPGAIDPENPGFRDWLDAGPAKAMADVPRIRSYDDMLSVVRLYTAGFHDGHLGYSDDTRPSPDIVVDGWHVSSRGGTAVVDRLVPAWPSALPPIGSRWLGCDGRTASRLVAEDIEPFTQAPVGEAGQRLLWDGATRPPLSDMRWRSCRFLDADGRAMDLPQVWRGVSFELFAQLMRGGQWAPARHDNAEQRLPDGTLWIRAGNFQPSADQNVALEHMLERLRDGPTARRVVFDARGNGGGDSGIGQRIFAAATGGLEMDDIRLDQTAVTSAWWRVSDIALAGLAWRESMLAERGGEDVELRLVKQLHDAMTAAQAQGESWVHQPGSDTPRLTREDMAARGAHLRRPIAQVALLTDENCVSACLDFADLIRSIPRSVHIGTTTGADTVYIDIGKVRLPSGNALILPLKVWRHRLRGNNEPLVPDIPLSFDREDEEAIRRDVLESLDRRTATTR